MRLPLSLAVGALVLLQVAAWASAVRHVSVHVPSAAERLAGAKPRRALRETRLGGLKIHGGSSATLGQFPWMVGFFVDSDGFCGGSLIGDTWVLTAANCVDGGKSFAVTAGSLAAEDGTESSRQVLTSTQAFRHPDFNALFMDNDIGLIKTPSAFTTGTNVAPIRLPSYAMAEDIQAGSKVTLSGWGLTSDSDSDLASTLTYAEVAIDDGAACLSYYGNQYIPNKICIDTKADLKSTCDGDSGAPLAVKEEDDIWTQVGVSSFGPASESCSSGLPIGFTRVATFLEFIAETTGIEIRDN